MLSPDKSNTRRKGRYGVKSSATIKKCSACASGIDKDIKDKARKLTYDKIFEEIELRKEKEEIDKSERKLINRKNPHLVADLNGQKEEESMAEFRQKHQKYMWSVVSSKKGNKKNPEIKSVYDVVPRTKTNLLGKFEHKHVFYSNRAHQHIRDGDSWERCKSKSQPEYTQYVHTSASSLIRDYPL